HYLEFFRRQVSGEFQYQRMRLRAAFQGHPFHFQSPRLLAITEVPFLLRDRRRWILPRLTVGGDDKKTPQDDCTHGHTPSGERRFTDPARRHSLAGPRKADEQTVRRIVQDPQRPFNDHLDGTVYRRRAWLLQLTTHPGRRPGPDGGVPCRLN